MHGYLSRRDEASKRTTMMHDANLYQVREAIQGLEHWTRAQIKRAVREYIENIVSTNDLDFRIVNMAVVGRQ